MEITSAPMLKYYDPSKPLTLETDASLNDLGVFQLQHEYPTYFASKNLQPHQKTYVKIERESLAVPGAMEKFCHFLYNK